jgi:polar amino acid transport system substrate-binding protein
MGRLIPVLLALCLAGCAVESAPRESGAGGQTPQATPRPTLDRIKERGRLVAGVRTAAPPFAFVDEKTREYVGFEIDICRFIADSLGVDLELKPVDPITSIPAVNQEVVDIVAAMLTHRFSLEESIDFSITYFMDGQRLLVKKPSGISSVSDLAGKKVATVRGSPAGKNILLAQPKAVLMVFDGYAQALSALESGKVDALTGDSTILLGLRTSATSSTEYIITEELLTKEPFAVGLPRNDSGLRNFVDLSLARMWTTGEYERVYAKWFGPQTTHHLPTTWEMEIWPM